MNYDDWKSTEPDYMLDEPADTDSRDTEWDNQFAAWDGPENGDPMDAFVDESYEYPQDWLSGPEDDFESLEYKERVVNQILAGMDEYLRFSTFRELMKLIVGNV